MTTTVFKRDLRRPVWQERPSPATQGAKTGTIIVILLVVAFPLYSVALTSFSTQASVNIAGGLVV
jgi:putative aldouronate transport system permease protein